MLIRLSADKTKVVFLHENGDEYKHLAKFPAFLKEGPYHYVPAQPNIVKNVLARYRRHRKTMQIEKAVLEIANTPIKLRPIPESFKYFTTPMDFQEIALRFLYTMGSGGILLDPGMGKSKVTLDYIALMGFSKVCIVCPKPLLFVWEDEIAVHRPDLTYHVVKTNDWEVEGPLVAEKQVTIINYNKAVTLKAHLEKVGYQYIHLDEFLIKDVKTERTDQITKLSKSIPHRSGGSGTLVNNTVMDVYAPVRFLEPSLVGTSYTNFREHHSVIRDNRDKTRKITVGYRRTDEARSILDSCCIVMTKEEWLKNMPAKVDHDRYIPMSEEQKKAYFELMRNYITQIDGEYLEIDNPLVMLSKLYQISNGFVYITEKPELEVEEKQSAVNNELGEITGVDFKTGKKKPKRRTVFFKEQPKVAALEKLITEDIPGRRSIIWFNMSAEYELIAGLLERLGKKFLSVKGGEGDVGSKVRKFNNDPTYEYLVCQAKSVNYGITVLGTTMEKLEDAEFDFDLFPAISPSVHTEIFYSLNFSLEVYLQQRDRIHRLGQKNTCDYYRLFSTSPVEQRIRDVIEDRLVLRRDMLVDFANQIKELDESLV